MYEAVMYIVNFTHLIIISCNIYLHHLVTIEKRGKLTPLDGGCRFMIQKFTLPSPSHVLELLFVIIKGRGI